jgi:hypothetical protein
VVLPVIPAIKPWPKRKNQIFADPLNVGSNSIARFRKSLISRRGCCTNAVTDSKNHEQTPDITASSIVIIEMPDHVPHYVRSV